MGKKVLEDGNHSDFLLVSRLLVIEPIEHMVALVEESGEWVGLGKGKILVERHEAEAPVTMLVALDIVLRPVVSTEIEGGGHVVDVLVDIEQLADSS